MLHILVFCFEFKSRKCFVNRKNISVKWSYVLHFIKNDNMWDSYSHSLVSKSSIFGVFHSLLFEFLLQFFWNENYFWDTSINNYLYLIPLLFHCPWFYYVFFMISFYIFYILVYIMIFILIFLCLFFYA